MKKYLLLIIVIAFPKIINAETFYSDYYLNDLECIESDICKKEEVIRYNTYSLEYQDMGYLLDNEEYIKDENDYKDDYLTEYININTNIKTHDKISFISMPTNLKIYELEVYYDGELINYTPRTNLYVHFPERLYDNDLDTYYVHGNSASFFILYLDKTYDLKDLTIKFYTKKQENVNISLDIASFIELNNDIDRWHIISFSDDGSNITKVNKDYEIERKYKYYKIDKITNNFYEDTLENIIEDDYIIDTYYYKRDKLVLSDEIIINDKEYNINDYIVSKTNDIKYNCDININESGIYNCEFILNDIIVNKKVIVDIKDVIDITPTISNNIKSNDILKINKEETTSSIKSNEYLINDKDNFIYSDNYDIDTRNENYIENTVYNNENINNDFDDINEDNNIKEYNSNYNNSYLELEDEKVKNKYKNNIRIIIGIILIIINVKLILKRKKDNVETI